MPKSSNHTTAQTTFQDISARRAQGWAQEARVQHLFPGQLEFFWARQDAEDAFEAYIRSRLAKLDRASWRRHQRLQYEDALRHPPPGGWDIEDDSMSGWGRAWKEGEPWGSSVAAWPTFLPRCSYTVDDDEISL
ncbi:hypothetical protein B0H13DRAFT_2352723 [Mycena leptocephala]|nr:hypothetical protein B0H13DRAFT_2352723 [Mycena leptocephala]